MKKQNLRNGMLVQYVNGKVRMVIRDTPFGDLLVGTDGWEVLEWYRDDLTHIKDINLTIMAVFEPQFPRDCMPKNWLPSENIIWSRKPKQKKSNLGDAKCNMVIMDEEMTECKTMTMEDFFDYVDKLIDFRATYRK